MLLEELGLVSTTPRKPLSLLNSYKYWQEMLFLKIVSLFEWSGLPNNLPAKEIEIFTMYFGFAGFVKDENCGFMVSEGGLSGVTQYQDIFKKFIYKKPIARGGNLEIGKECVIIENNQLRNSLFPMVERYAFLLSHTEITLKCALINLRTNRAFISDSDATVENIKAWEKSLVDGNVGTILDKSLNVPGFGDTTNNLMQGNLNSTYLRDIAELRNDLLRMFYTEIGVNYSKEKKANMISDEITQNNDMLLLNVNSMLKSRQQACAEINKLWNLNVSVDFSEELQKIRESEESGDNADEN